MKNEVNNKIRRAYFHISCLLFSASSVFMSCEFKTYSKETNTTVNQLTMKEQFPNHKTAFEKIDDNVILYNPTGEKLSTIDLKKTICTTYLPELSYFDNLIKINDFLYFSPKKVQQYFTFPTGDVGTGSGAFSTEKKFNNLGLINSEKIEYPNDHGKVKISNVNYNYNKFAQLLKIEEDGKVIIENKYDENSNIIETNTSKEQIKFHYSVEGRVIKEEIKKKDGTRNIFNYNYNSSKQIEKKSNDDKTLIKEYQYDSNHRLIGIIEYSGIIDKYDPNEIKNHFVEKSYSYDKDQIAEEKYYEYTIAKSSVLINGKRQPITIEEQKKLAWQKFKDQSEIPLLGIERKYSYQSNEIHVTVNKLDFSNSMRDGKTGQSAEVINSEIIRFKLDNSGRIIKKEVYNKDKNLEEKQEFSY